MGTSCSRISASGPVLDESFDQVADAVAQQVVAQVHDKAGIAQERLRGEHGVGQAQRRLLGDVGDLDAPAGAVADGLLDLGGGIADDDADVGDAGVAQRFDAVEEHGFVGHGNQLFGAGVGDGPQAAAGAAAKD